MSGDDRITTISELRHGLKNVNCFFIVIEAGTILQTKDGSLVRKCRVADKTGSITFSIWNEEAEAINVGEIIRLTRGYSSVWKGGLVLYCGKYGTVEKLGEFTMVFSETPDMSLRTETPSPRSNSPPPTQSSRQQQRSTAESTSNEASNYNEVHSQSGSSVGGRHDNHTSYSSSQHYQSEFHDMSRHHKNSAPVFHHHPNIHHHSTPPTSHSTPPTSHSTPPTSQESNGRFYSNEHEDSRYSNDRRSHYVQSHDNHSKSRHHPYQRHNTNGRR